MSALEKKWWFMLPVVMLTTICTRYLFDSVGLPFSEFGLAHWIMYGLCFGALWRVMSFIGWLLVLSASPAAAGVKSSQSP